MKEELKTHSDYIKVLQAVFNRFIRLRDKDKGCISCGKELTGIYHAGHFFPTSSHPELRFNEDNVMGQCIKCNAHLHGNLGQYANKLPKRIGWERFEKLYEPTTALKLTIPEILELIKFYKEKIKTLEP